MSIDKQQQLANAKKLLAAVTARVRQCAVEERRAEQAFREARSRSLAAADQQANLTTLVARLRREAKAPR